MIWFVLCLTIMLEVNTLLILTKTETEDLYFSQREYYVNDYEFRRSYHKLLKPDNIPKCCVVAKAKA